MDIDDFISDVDKQVEWFCDKVIEPYPLNPTDRDKIFQRMKDLGWIRESEIETYKILTREG